MIRNVFPPPVAMAIIALYLLFVLWLHIAQSVGNLCLAFDRLARHALSRAEKLDGWIAGGSVVLGIPLLLLGMVSGQEWLLIPGATLVAAAFPLAYTFNNRSIPGRLLFGAIAGFVLTIGGAHLLAPTLDLNRDSLGSATAIAFLAVILVTWISNLRFLNRRG